MPGFRRDAQLLAQLVAYAELERQGVLEDDAEATVRKAQRRGRWHTHAGVFELGLRFGLRIRIWLWLGWCIFGFKLDAGSGLNGRRFDSARPTSSASAGSS